MVTFYNITRVSELNIVNFVLFYFSFIFVLFFIYILFSYFKLKVRVSVMSHVTVTYITMESIWTLR